MTSLDGYTRIIAHVGDPTGSFKAPMIYNPYFESIRENAAVVPMGVTAADFATSFPLIMRFTNVDGALITMPHKIKVVEMLAEASPAVLMAGACNAVKRRADGSLMGDMFDGEGFVRGLLRKGRKVAGASALVVGAGGVGSAIAASLAVAGVARLGLFDVNPASAEALAERVRTHCPAVSVTSGSNDPAGFDLVVNATPLGMSPGDPLPFDVMRAEPTALIGEVVMKQEMTPLLTAAEARGLEIQKGIEMLFEQIPAYLEFFGFAPTTSDTLRRLARISY